MDLLGPTSFSPGFEGFSFLDGAVLVLLIVLAVSVVYIWEHYSRKRKEKDPT